MRPLLLLCFILLVAHQSVCAEAENEEKKAPTISYYQIKPSLVANLASGGKYIRCDVQLMTHDEVFLEELNLHGPAIRHALLLLLSEQDGKKLKTTQGKETLRKSALMELQKLMKEVSGKDEVKALFFTTFFVQ
jgi:flagellar FliL protein